MKEIQKTDLLIIGAGPGGYVGAIYAAKKGLDVTLVEQRWIGGTCLNAGCIPTKALIRSAEVFEEIKNAGRFGIHAEGVFADWTEIQGQKGKVTDGLRSGIVLLLEKAGVKVIEGTASFASSGLISVRTKAEETLFRAKDVLIATGARTKHLPVPGIDLPIVLDSEQILSLTTLPKSLVIIGGGVIGMEFAFVFGRLGVKVNVLEFLPQILPTVDADIVQRLARFSKMANIVVTTNARVVSVSQTPEGTALVKYLVNDLEKTLESDLVLEAVGRIPDLSGLNLPQTQIEVKKNGGIAVDERMKTTQKGIHAIGDCTNLMQLAHVASHQAFVAVDDILGKETKMEYDFVPSVIFTSPEIAMVGKTEKNLQETNTPYQVSRIPFGSNGKALILNQPSGFVKLIRETATRHLVGAAIFGTGANDLIATLTVALKNGLTTEAIKKTIFAHPTLSELLHEAALSLDGEAIHTAE